jgi:hypothetical protein
MTDTTRLKRTEGTSLKHPIAICPQNYNLTTSYGNQMTIRTETYAIYYRTISLKNSE